MEKFIKKASQKIMKRTSFLVKSDDFGVKMLVLNTCFSQKNMFWILLSCKHLLHSALQQWQYATNQV